MTNTTKKYCSVKERLTREINELQKKDFSFGLSKKEKRDLEYLIEHLKLVEVVQKEFPPINHNSERKKEKTSLSPKSSIRLRLRSLPHFKNRPSDRAHSYLKLNFLNSKIRKLKQRLDRCSPSKKASYRNLQNLLNGAIKRREKFLEGKSQLFISQKKSLKRLNKATDIAKKKLKPYKVMEYSY